jgi:hypothetical protein
VHERERQVELLSGSATHRPNRRCPILRVVETRDEILGKAEIHKAIGGREVRDVTVHAECLVEHGRLRTVAEWSTSYDSAGVGVELAGKDAQ